MPTDTDTFTNCRCPHCRTSLSDTPVWAKRCPLCNQPLDPSAVWGTRTYPGHIALPGWLRAFGWPFLLILAGIGFSVYTYIVAGEVYLRISGLIIIVGIVYFIVKFYGYDE